MDVRRLTPSSTLGESIDDGNSSENAGTWFSENYDAHKWSIHVDRVLHKEKTPFQDILIFNNKCYGNVLALSGAIQFTEKDEFSYSEMMAHVPLNCHPAPKQVLIVGGGDGGVLREVLKHDMVDMVTQVEIDQRVIDLCKQYFPRMASEYDNPRCNLIIGDAQQHVQQSTCMYDVIINDCTDRDQDDISAPLYKQQYWEELKRALRPGGITIQIEENLFHGQDKIQDNISRCRNIYPSVAYACVFVPSFCGGQGFRLCSLKPDFTFRNPVRVWTKQERKNLGLRYYNHEVHRAAFAIPEYGKTTVSAETSDSSDDHEMVSP